MLLTLSTVLAKCTTSVDSFFLGFTTLASLVAVILLGCAMS